MSSYITMNREQIKIRPRQSKALFTRYRILFMPDRFHEFDTQKKRSGMFTRSPETSPMTLFPVKMVIQALQKLYRSQVLGTYRVGLRCLHMKQTSMDCTKSLFVPPGEADQSCTELLEQSGAM